LRQDDSAGERGEWNGASDMATKKKATAKKTPKKTTGKRTAKKPAQNKPAAGPFKSRETGRLFCIAATSWLGHDFLPGDVIGVCVEEKGPVNIGEVGMVVRVSVKSYARERTGGYYERDWQPVRDIKIERDEEETEPGHIVHRDLMPNARSNPVAFFNCRNSPPPRSLMRLWRPPRRRSISLCRRNWKEISLVPPLRSTNACRRFEMPCVPSTETAFPIR
jgi:hypothetical protein